MKLTEKLLKISDLAKAEKEPSNLIPEPNKDTYKELDLHHGSKAPEDFDKFDLKHHSSGFYPGIYTTTDKNRAKEHGRHVKVSFKGHVFEIKDAKHGNELQQQLSPRSGSGFAVAQKIKDAGYHAIKRGNEHIILDPEKASINKDLKKALPASLAQPIKNIGDSSKSDISNAIKPPKVAGMAMSNPMKVGQQATVKMPKAKRPADPFGKPSLFFKSDEFSSIKHPSIQKLRDFLIKVREKK